MPLRFFLAALLSLLVPGPGRTESAPAPALPEGVAPLPAESAQHFQELLAAAEKYRGLTALRPVPAGTLEEPELRKKMAESLDEELSPDQLAAAEIAAKAFGLIPESMDLSRYLTELLTSEVAGFYDPLKDYMALVRRGEAVDEEDVVIVHELTHALQDQHFDLQRFEAVDPMSDASTALTALAEGDATLTMTSFLAGRQLEETPGIGEVMKSVLGDPEALTASDAPGGAELAKAPAWVRDSLLFGYVQGFSFCLEVRRAGGQKLLDYAFATDPPRSSEQILHPEKWLGKRDDPILLRWPDLAPALPGWRKVSSGETGEATLQSLLRLHAKDRGKADAAAAGWGGDRFEVYARAGRRVLVWWTEWDSEADAAEFQAAARGLGRGWRVDALSARRIMVLRGDLDRPRRAAVRARLAAAEAVKPANVGVDLKAVVGLAGVQNLEERVNYGQLSKTATAERQGAWRVPYRGRTRESRCRNGWRSWSSSAAMRPWCACRRPALACSAWRARRRATTG
ncbi:MAG TPA: hypothetical protein VIC28_18285 [Thermoanaerobaculia bacterium]|jgi:hypothetical protein